MDAQGQLIPIHDRGGSSSTPWKPLGWFLSIVDNHRAESSVNNGERTPPTSAKETGNVQHDVYKPLLVARNTNLSAYISVIISPIYTRAHLNNAI